MPARSVILNCSAEPLRSLLAEKLSEQGFESLEGEASGYGIVVGDAPGASTVSVDLRLPFAGGDRSVASVVVPANADVVVGAVLAMHHMRPGAEITEDVRKVLSHDIRGPFAIILGYCEILRAEVQGGLTEYQSGAVGKIERQSEKLLKMMEGVEQRLAEGIGGME